jgi:hypothetical protein
VERILGRTAKLNNRQTCALGDGSAADRAVILKFDQGSFHFDIQIGGEAVANLKRGERTGFNERAPSSFERLFQIPAKLAIHVSLLSMAILLFGGRGSLWSKRNGVQCEEAWSMWL